MAEISATDAARNLADLLDAVEPSSSPFRRGDQGTPRGAHDLIIAATARATGRIVLTADRSALALYVVLTAAGHGGLAAAAAQAVSTQ